MKKRILVIMLALSVMLSATGFAPVKNDTKGWKKIFKEAIENAGAEKDSLGEDIPYTYKGQALVLENADGDAMSSGSYFVIGLDAETAKKYPKLSKWVLAHNQEQASYQEEYVLRTAGDVYEMYDSGWEASFSNDGTFYPVRSDSNVFSFILGTYSYMGGAHGYQSYKGFNIDPATGDEICFYDVFDSTDGLADILFKEILAQNEDLVDWFGDLLDDENAYKNSDERKSFTDLVKRNLEESPVTLAWALDYDGVRFYFEDYSLGSYAAGARNCKLRFDDYPELFTENYKTETIPDHKEIAVQEDAATPSILRVYGLDAVYAYASFLQDYMKHPAVAENDDGDDTPADADDVLINVIYLDDDEIPELVIANGNDPENPVHLFSYDPESQEISEDGFFSMYGKMYYEPGKGNFIPMYYLPYGDGEVYSYENGKPEKKISWQMDFSGDTEKYYVNGKLTSKSEVEKTRDMWQQHPFRSVFSEFKPICLGEALNSEEGSGIRQKLQRAAGLGRTGNELDGVWYSEKTEKEKGEYFTYLELDGYNFAVYDENGYVEYMGVLGDNIEEFSLHNNCSFEAYTMDGGFFSFGEWLQADDPAEDHVEFHDQTFTRYDSDYSGSPVRSPRDYLNTDIVFLGEHSGVGSDGTLKIEQANVQTGGYEVTIDFGNGHTASGNANPMHNGGLFINYGTIDDTDYFTGEIFYEESSMEYDLRINRSDSEEIPEDSVFTFSL